MAGEGGEGGGVDQGGDAVERGGGGRGGCGDVACWRKGDSHRIETGVSDGLVYAVDSRVCRW